MYRFIAPVSWEETCKFQKIHPQLITKIPIPFRQSTCLFPSKTVPSKAASLCHKTSHIPKFANFASSSLGKTRTWASPEKIPEEDTGKTPGKRNPSRPKACQPHRTTSWKRNFQKNLQRKNSKNRTGYWRKSLKTITSGASRPKSPSTRSKKASTNTSSDRFPSSKENRNTCCDSGSMPTTDGKP